jgi:hypothetical protein
LLSSTRFTMETYRFKGTAKEQLTDGVKIGQKRGVAEM